ncbi:Thiol-disulfide oxidoreductase ResA, partial [Durusdinium trenchii]
MAAPEEAQMIRTFRMLVISSLAAMLCCAPAAIAQEAKPIAVGDSAPPIGVEAWSQLPEGIDRYDWESLKGTTVVIEFWATWCGPCIAAIPHMNDLAEKFEGEVVFISVTDEPEEKTLALREKRPMKSVLGFDTDKSMHKAYGVRGIPATFVVDKEGKIASITHPNRLTAEKLRGHVNGKHDEPDGPAEAWSVGAISSGVDPFDRAFN